MNGERLDPATKTKNDCKIKSALAVAGCGTTCCQILYETLKVVEQ